jgi:hypothetical protein
MKPSVSSASPRFGVVAAYVALSIAIAWPVLYVWSNCYCTDNNLLQPWPKDVAQAANFLPEAALSGALIVWAAFGRKSVVTLAGFGAVAGWIVMGLSIAYVLPWAGAVHGFAAWPNPVTTLLAFACALANSIGCSRIVARRLRRGPTIGLTASLMLVSFALLTGLGVYLNVQRSGQAAALRRGQEIGLGCEMGEYPFRRPSPERCFELAEGTRKNADGADTRALAREIYEWGCGAGEPSSCVGAGAMYENGDGLRADLRKAAELYARGCHFSSEKCGELARVFNQAPGLVKESCRKVTFACVTLGRMYESGTQVARSSTQALVLFDVACAAGDEVGCYESRLHR